MPLVLGETGHIDLRPEDIPSLEARVSDILSSLKERYLSTPLVLLSPLAEGADRLVARIALAQDVRLIVPLPMPKTMYLEDFTSSESREEFAGLLSAAAHFFELPLQSRADDVRADSEARAKQYEQVGACIARHSQILIALSDGTFSDKTGGTFSDKTGGTSQVVRFHLQGPPPPYAPKRGPLDTIDSGPAYHVVTPRKQNTATDHAAFSLLTYFPPFAASQATRKEGAAQHRHLWHSTQNSDGEGPEWRHYDGIYRHLDTFNADSIAQADTIARSTEESRHYLLPCASYPEAENLLRELGKEALSENGVWVMLHRSRPLEVPMGG